MTSVPAALSVPLAVTRATLSGVVGRVGVPMPCSQFSRRLSAASVRLSARATALLAAWLGSRRPRRGNRRAAGRQGWVGAALV